MTTHKFPRAVCCVVTACEVLLLYFKLFHIAATQKHAATAGKQDFQKKKSLRPSCARASKMATRILFRKEELPPPEEKEPAAQVGMATKGLVGKGARARQSWQPSPVRPLFMLRVQC